MAGEAAIRKVLNRLNVWLNGHCGAGVSLFLDRPFDEPFRDEDLPYVNLRCSHTHFSVFDHANMLHQATIKFDIVSGASTTANIDEIQANIAATLTARIWAMDSTPGQIGELLQERLPVSIGPEQDQFEMSDVGETTFSWSLSFITPIDNFRTIMGHNGPVS